MSQWTSSEIHYLKENYATENTQVIVQRLNKPRKVITARANSLGLKKKDGVNEFNHGHAKMEKVLTLIITMTKESLTTNQIAEMMDVTQRSGFRYIQLIKTCGFNIKESHGRYFIHGCPVCGHTTNNHH